MPPSEAISAEDMARQIERENLLARINIPMARVEVRTDEGGHPLDMDVANLTFKQLLLIQFYADPAFARAFRYDQRRSGPRAPQRGRRGPSRAAGRDRKPVHRQARGRARLPGWTLEQVRGLAEALGLWAGLAPLVEMADGAPNTAERMRDHIRQALGAAPDQTELEVPTDLLKELAVEREASRGRRRGGHCHLAGALGPEAAKLRDLLQRAREEVRHDPAAPIRFRPRVEALSAELPRQDQRDPRSGPRADPHPLGDQLRRGAAGRGAPRRHTDFRLSARRRAGDDYYDQHQVPGPGGRLSRTARPPR